MIDILPIRQVLILNIVLGFFLYGCTQSAEEQIQTLQKLPQNKLDSLLCVETSKNEIKLLLRAGANANCNCSYKNSSRNVVEEFLFSTNRESTPIEEFIRNQELDLVKCAVENGAKFKHIDISNYLYLDMWKYLFGKGYSYRDFSDKVCITDTVFIDFLLNKKMPIDFKFKSGKTLAHFAMRGPFKENTRTKLEQDDTTTLNFLERKGLNILETIYQPPYPITYYSLMREHRYNTLLFYLKRFPKDRDKSPLNELLAYILENTYNDETFDLIDFLIYEGVDVNSNPYNMINAVEKNHVKILHLLIKNDLKTDYSYTHSNSFIKVNMFTEAVYNCKGKLLKELIEKYPSKIDRQTLVECIKYKLNTSEYICDKSQTILFNQCLEKLKN